jgi:hypothetical protein
MDIMMLSVTSIEDYNNALMMHLKKLGDSPAILLINQGIMATVQMGILAQN